MDTIAKNTLAEMQVFSARKYDCGSIAVPDGATLLIVSAGRKELAGLDEKNKLGNVKIYISSDGGKSFEYHSGFGYNGGSCMDADAKEMEASQTVIGVLKIATHVKVEVDVISTHKTEVNLEWQ
jgi:hypothetical protein